MYDVWDEMKKKQEDNVYIVIWIRWRSRGAWSYICIYTNAEAKCDTFQLFLRQDFYNKKFKIEDKILRWFIALVLFKYHIYIVFCVRLFLI